MQTDVEYSHHIMMLQRKRKKHTGVRNTRLVNFCSLHVGSGTNMGMVRVCLEQNNRFFFTFNYITTNLEKAMIKK